MRGMSLLCVLAFLCNTLSAQYVYTIKADSVKLTNCDSSELIIENHTQNVPGFLFNTGNGRTIFKRGAQKINDSLYLIGADTLKTLSKAWVQGGNSFAATGIFGTLDNNHVDIYTNNLSRARLTNTGSLLLGTSISSPYMLDVAGPTRIQNSFVINSTLPGNLGNFQISPNAAPVGTPADFTVAVSSGARIFFSDFQTLFSSSIYAGNGLTTPGPVNCGDLTANGSPVFGGANDNVDNYIYMAAGPNHRKAAFIEKALGAYGVMDLSLAFNNISDNSVVQGSDTKVVFKANGNVLIGTTADNGNKLQVLGTSYFSSNLGLGTSTPTAQLHTTGTVRFAGLTSDTTQTHILVSDANGNLFYRDASTLAANEPIRSLLAVNGPITAQKLTLSARDWPDYVFDSAYRLLPLPNLEEYIHQYNHLPGIRSAAAVEKSGTDVGETQVALLKKIEELTLYTIDQDKKLIEQDKKLADQKEQIKYLQKKMETIEQLIINKSGNKL